MNSITLVGRAGRDPELRYFESGKAVASLTLAVNRGRDKEPDWFNLEVWDKQAQVAADYVRKGSLIGVIGRLEMQKWTDKTTGETKSKPVVVVTRLELLGSKRDSSEGDFLSAAPATPAARPAPQSTPTQPATWATGGDGDISDEEVPF
jgi:single-strand DNA-binding protein